MRQHVTAVEAACAIGGGSCEGLAVGTSEITFTPGAVKPGEYHFAVGTAGSTSLVLQTVLMPLVLANGPSRLVLEGGTHNIFAPPFDFIARSFLPIINRMGPTVEAKLVRHGFYPRGGGRIEIDITPAPLKQIECLERGMSLAQSATAIFAAIPPEVADREINVVRKMLPQWPEEAISVRELPEDQGPGTILLLEAQFENVTEIVSGFGKLGLSAEKLAGTAANRMAGYLASGAFAGPYLADQLLLPFAVAGGGTYTSVKPSQHCRTAADIISRFLPLHCSFTEREGGTHVVTVG
jgi:RNA 3'-terminal phosphate cyclase (ATP)